MSKSDLPPEVLEILEALGIDPDQVETIEITAGALHDFVEIFACARSLAKDIWNKVYPRRYEQPTINTGLCPDCVKGIAFTMLAAEAARPWVDKAEANGSTKDETIKQLLIRYEELLRNPPELASDDNQSPPPAPTVTAPSTLQ